MCPAMVTCKGERSGGGVWGRDVGEGSGVAPGTSVSGSC